MFVSSLLLLPLFIFSLFLSFTFFRFLFRLTALVRLDHPYLMHTSLNMYNHYTWGLLVQKLAIILWASSSPHMCFSIRTFSSPLYASIWLKFWPSWIAWLLCLCPTFPLVRLGHKGSTTAIVTAGSSGCVPQTGWSRKLSFLREYSVGDLKDDFFIYLFICPQMFFCSFRSPHMHLRACLPGKGTPNGTILPGRCFLLTM